MNKKKIFQRIAVTLIGVPLVLLSIFYFPHYHHALFFLVVMFFTLSGAREMKFLLEQKMGLTLPVPFWISGIFPITAYLSLFFMPTFSVIWTVLVLLILFILSLEIFQGLRDNFTNSLTRSVMILFMLVYPGLFTPYVVYFAQFEHASHLYMFFFLLVFSTDVFAYVFGMMFGKTSRGIVKASPNKSIAGFIGGICMTMLIALSYASLFRTSLPPFQWWHMILLGGLVSLASIVGDLFESVLKRSVQVKDSGHLMPGRGGILDTIDSIVFAAPVYYYLVYIWYMVR